MPRDSAMQSSKDGMDEAARVAKAAASNLTRFLIALAEFLELQSKYAPYREMAKYIREGKEVSFFPVQGRCTKELAYELQKNDIPFVNLNDKDTFIIKQGDFEKVSELNRRVLISKSCYYQDIASAEFEDVIARHEKIKNKDIFTVSCNNSYEVEVLKNKCNDITAGFMVGIEEESNDDKWNLSVHSTKVFRKNPNNHDFCKAYLQMCMSLYGPNNYIKMQQVDDDMNFDIKVAELKGTQDDVYIVSVTDNKQYLCLNKNGFEYYSTTVDENEKRHDYKINECLKDSPNYEVELQRCLDRMMNKHIVYDDEVLAEHLKTEEVNLDTDRPLKTYEQFKISLMESRMADKIDEMIDHKVEEQDIKFVSSMEAFHFYRKECIEIMKVLSEYEYDTPEIPTGYTPEDFEYLLNQINENYIDFENDYEMVMNRLEEVECSIRTAKPQKREYVTQKREEYEER